jgi:hypothetical protein
LNSRRLDILKQDNTEIENLKAEMNKFALMLTDHKTKLKKIDLTRKIRLDLKEVIKKYRKGAENLQERKIGNFGEYFQDDNNFSKLVISSKSVVQKNYNFQKTIHNNSVEINRNSIRNIEIFNQKICDKTNYDKMKTVSFRNYKLNENCYNRSVQVIIFNEFYSINTDSNHKIVDL